MMAEPAEASTSSKVKVWKFIPTCCISYTPSAVMFDFNMGSKIDEITSRLQDIVTQKNDLDLKDIGGGTVRSNIVRERLLTSSLVDEYVYGREKDKEAILELLLRGDEKVCVIPIIGMGGVGKTTLAQLVYNDDKVNDSFGLKAWVCVSDVFDVSGITKTILVSLTSQNCDFMDLNTLQVKLKELLSGKNFFLVLDDIWNENYEKWDLLRRPLLAGAPGSKIIVTTRNEGVALIVRSLPPYHLKELLEDDCLSLLARHSLGRRNFDSHPDLKEIGEQIAKKCKGLPLAAKSLGGLLRTKLLKNEWEDILNSNIWDLPDEKVGIIPALQLSYHHLPSHLKGCFVYCSIFPKDYEFDKDELVLLWMAEGFLQHSKGKKPMEDFGRECFDDLLSRSFFQQSSGKESHLFVMHDLMNDLAQYVAEEICFRLEDKLEGDHDKISKRACHASYIRQEYEFFSKFKLFYKVERLRTFLPLPVQKSYWWASFYLTNKVGVDLLPKLQCLRVLSLSGYSISELPDSIGDLKHLRYLNLVTRLYNLQTLLLRGCIALCKLPSSIENLTNLRHLDITDTGQLQEMPPGIGKLTSLQTLSKIAVGKRGDGLGLIADLKNLSLSIVGLQNVTDLRDAKEANLRCNEKLDELGMEWSRVFDDSRNGKLEMDVLDLLRPHINLKRLKIELYGGMKFPSWIGDPSFSQIVNLTLSHCEKCKSLPPLGKLPMLKDLCVRGMHKVEFYRDDVFPFSSLETNFLGHARMGGMVFSIT